MENNNRRNFLKTGAMAGAALLSTSAFGATALEKDRTSVKAGDNPATLKKRVLGSGKQRLEVTAIGLGCMGMSFHRSVIPDKQASAKLIRKAVDLGVNFFDTAEVYGPFTNEELVGETLAPIRKDILICSKFGFNIENGKMAGRNSKPAHIREVVEQSLKRLRTDHIDLLYQHSFDPTVPIEDVAGTVKDLIAEGKVRALGLCGVNGETIRKAHAVQPLTAIQSEYSLMEREPENEVLGVCEELGIGFVPYSPMNRGLITGYINERTKFIPENDNRPRLPLFQPKAIVANWSLIEVLKEFGDHRGLTVTQVALAWLLAQKPFIVPIPGTIKIAHLQENLQAMDYEFTPDELKKLTEDLSKIKIAG
ncbi:aldo/keto reductase [Sphingobacterium thalpophilum]|nr:aldo/keto reductase [Sphingobacterium thalpophilum]